LLAEDVGELNLFGRDFHKLQILESAIRKTTGKDPIISTDLQNLRNVKVIITVSSAIQAIIHPNDLQPGSVICDVARPRDVAASVAQKRNDVFVFDGGTLDVPGDVNFNFDFGFPQGKAYACMAETIALTLEGRFEDYTLGKQITRDRVDEITTIATKHGFKLNGLRSFERPVTPDQIDRIRKNASRPYQVK
jgi:predicted amino acid dehydrogenase